jgi:uncharacterized lipoprotein YddW (UPF0748 family)
MKIRIAILLALLFGTNALLFAQQHFIYRPTATLPPELPREFRGAWIAIVATNQDWPSKPGLPVAQQKTELIALLDRAAQLHFNAVIFQVRAACDAMYASQIEPWSDRLTGTQGQPPQPFYDPLAFAIEEAHKRGLELHAWFNPFRARHKYVKFIAPTQISRTHPELVREYGDQFWLDPGEPAVRDYVLRVVMDVVKRYDVDGVTFDDYFYPYPEKNSVGRKLDFPDYATWVKYGVPDGYSRDDWRRENVNKFIESVYQSVKATKPWVKFGVSPFGVWRPSYPSQIKGMDSYTDIYADSRKWLADGWLDYFSPQLYWPIDEHAHSFPVLLQWWREQNAKGRHIWPSLDDVLVGREFSISEIPQQIQIVRQQSADAGEIHFHLRSVTDNPSLAQVVLNEYAQPALVPASPWLASTFPAKPALVAESTRIDSSARWENLFGQQPWKWILQIRGTNNVWATQILPANQTNVIFSGPSPDFISLRAMDRAGNLSSPTVVRKLILRSNGKTLIYVVPKN